MARKRLEMSRLVQKGKVIKAENSRCKSSLSDAIKENRSSQYGLSLDTHQRQSHSREVGVDDVARSIHWLLSPLVGEGSVNSKQNGRGEGSVDQDRSSKTTITSRAKHKTA